MHRCRARAGFLSFLATTLTLLFPPFAQARSAGPALEVLSLPPGAQEVFDPWTPLEVLQGSSLAGKTPRGSREGKAFTPAGKKEIDAANAAKNGGTNKCENCGTEVVPAEKSQSGVTPPPNQRERDHIVPKSKGGEGAPSNGQILCRECNLEKSDKTQ